MKTRDPLVSVLIASIAFALCGCASVPQGEIDSRAAAIKVYTPPELTGASYESVGHVWVDSWRTAFWAPTYPTEDEAVRALRAEAARLNGNGIVNIVCLDQNVPKKSPDAAPAILCYSNALRVPKSGG